MHISSADTDRFLAELRDRIETLMGRRVPQQPREPDRHRHGLAAYLTSCQLVLSGTYKSNNWEPNDLQLRGDPDNKQGTVRNGYWPLRTSAPRRPVR